MGALNAEIRDAVNNSVDCLVTLGGKAPMLGPRSFRLIAERGERLVAILLLAIQPIDATRYFAPQVPLSDAPTILRRSHGQ